MGAGGSHSQAMSDSEEGERGTGRVRWTDCQDEEGQEEEEQETEGEREKEAEGEKETGQEKMTTEKHPSLEKREESKHEGKEEVREEKGAQEAHEREREARAQEERERQARKKANALEEQREQGREVEAQAGHQEEGERTTREEFVGERKEEDANSVHANDECHVSNRHMTWWRNAWWIRVDTGPHMRSARGRRKTWRAAKQAAEQVRDGNWVGETRGKGERTGKIAGRKRP